MMKVFQIGRYIFECTLCGDTEVYNSRIKKNMQLEENVLKINAKFCYIILCKK